MGTTRLIFGLLILSAIIWFGYSAGERRGHLNGYWEGTIDGYMKGFKHGSTTGVLCDGNFETCLLEEVDKSERRVHGLDPLRPDDGTLYMHKLEVPDRVKELQNKVWF